MAWQVEWDDAAEPPDRRAWVTPKRLRAETEEGAWAAMRAEILRDLALLKEHERPPRLVRDVVLTRLEHGGVEPGEVVDLGAYVYRYVEARDGC